MPRRKRQPTLVFQQSTSFDDILMFGFINHRDEQTCPLDVKDAATIRSWLLKRFPSGVVKLDCSLYAQFCILSRDLVLECLSSTPLTPTLSLLRIPNEMWQRGFCVLDSVEPRSVTHAKFSALRKQINFGWGQQGLVNLGCDLYHGLHMTRGPITETFSQWATCFAMGFRQTIEYHKDLPIWCELYEMLLNHEFDMIYLSGVDERSIYYCLTLRIEYRRPVNGSRFP